MLTQLFFTERTRLPRIALAAVLLLALLLGLTARPPAVRAAAINVVANEVAINANSLCSLREAIVNANNDAATHADCAAGSGADTINLPAAATFTITTSHAYNQGNTGLPQVTSAITIEGNGSTITHSSAGSIRLFAISNTGNLTLNDLTLSNGKATSDAGGGAVLNAGGTLTINDSTLSGNDGTGSNGGGAITANGGTTTINTSTLTNNHAKSGPGGGGIHVNNTGTLIVNDSTISGNSADIQPSGGGTSGGGISVGYSGSNNVTINRSTLNNNTANSGGALFLGSGSVTLNNSTVSGNVAQTGGGGGLHANGGTLTLNNTTVTGNSTSNAGGGILNNGTLNLNRSIISGNTGNTGWDSGYEVTAWGGVATSNYNVFGRSGITNARAFNGFTPGGTNFNATDGGTPTAIGSILNTSLAGNGGPTQTHALVAGSPAVDRGPSTDCTNAPINGVDQRGYPRNVDGNAAASANECDSGSFEYLSSPPPTTGDIIIVKEATPEGSTEFSFTQTITDIGFNLTDDGVNPNSIDFLDVTPGSYTVTEDGESGWTLDDITCDDANSTGNTGTGAATIDLDAGETITCTFTNSRDTGTIKIVKAATPEDDTPFSFTEDILNTGFTLTDPADDTEEFNDVPTGAYSVTEDGETDWTLTDITCDDANSTGDTGTGAATINLEKDETVTCTFTNIYNSPVDLFMSTRTAGTTGDGLDFGPEDVLRWDGSAWSLFFDGSAADLMPFNAKHNINAIWIPDPGADDFVLSFAQNRRHIPDLTGKVDGMDLVKWDGSNFSFFFDGSDVDLTLKVEEKIDALHILPGALWPGPGGPCLEYLLISTQGPGRVSNPGEPAIKFGGEDVLGFCATSLGEDTEGLWSLVLDGSAEGMPRNATESISFSNDGQTMYLTTYATFNVDSAVGGHSMVYKYDFGTGEFSGPFFSAPAAGLPATVNALHVVGDLP